MIQNRIEIQAYICIQVMYSLVLSKKSRTVCKYECEINALPNPIMRLLKILLSSPLKTVISLAQIHSCL